ncbi:MAG TPA: spore germination protein GerW family protein [Thermoanaerobaculia bacterium]|nr:spore germination protein GerW family protein [Thermoanaerobaculia bacterium]
MAMDRTFIETLAEKIPLHASAKQVYGDPVERDGTTIIPVARVQWGFGAGGLGRGVAERGGGGGGVRAKPSGYIELRNGQSRFRPILDLTSGAALAAAAAAGLLLGMLIGRSRR